MRNRIIVVVTLALATGCSSDDHRRPELRRTLDAAQITLIDSIDRATTVEAGRPVTASLRVGTEPVFSVGIRQDIAQQDVLIHIVTGAVLSRGPTPGATGFCPGAIPIAQALAIAEARKSGEAVAVVPDDDVACAFEIQVLVADVLWEVKVGGDGAVLEEELSDEYGGEDD